MELPPKDTIPILFCDLDVTPDRHVSILTNEWRYNVFSLYGNIAKVQVPLVQSARQTFLHIFLNLKIQVCIF
jgi:hypothetical protein